MSVIGLVSVLVNLYKSGSLGTFTAFLLTKFSKVCHFAWNFFFKIVFMRKFFKNFSKNFRTQKYAGISTKVCIFWVKKPYFSIFWKLSVIRLFKVGYRFSSVIRMSVSDRFRLGQIWSVSVRLSVNRIFEPITSTKY